MKEVILLICASEYSVEDERTKAVNEGLSISYLMTNDFMPQANKNLHGYRVMKGSVSLDSKKELTAVPAYYEADFDIRPGASGKPELRPVSLKYKKAVAG